MFRLRLRKLISSHLHHALSRQPLNTWCKGVKEELQSTHFLDPMCDKQSHQHDCHMGIHSQPACLEPSGAHKSRRQRLGIHAVEKQDHVAHLCFVACPTQVCLQWHLTFAALLEKHWAHFCFHGKTSLRRRLSGLSSVLVRKSSLWNSSSSTISS